MAHYESDNATVRESLAQVQGEINIFRGNMETILEILQIRRAFTFVNLAAANVTCVDGVTNATVAVDAIIETTVETVTPTTESR